MTIWIPFSDATSESSCIYVLPISKDPNYPVNLSINTVPDDAKQHIISLPATAGSVLGWNQYIIHWGGQMGFDIWEPRISLGIYYQSGDENHFDPFLLERTDKLSFNFRLGVISRMVLKYQHLGFPTNVLKFCEMNDVILKNLNHQ
jgi:hypothetical protein